MAVVINLNSVLYEAQSKLLEIATKIADTRNILKPEIVKLAYQGQRISDFLRALDSRTYITQTEQDQIINCLIKTAEIFEFPIAPTINFATRPDVVLGTTNNITNNITNVTGTPFSLVDLDIGAEVADEFSALSARGVMYHFVIYNTANTRQHEGLLHGSWLPSGTLNYTYEYHPPIGSTPDVILSLGINSGNVQLVATATSDDWNIFGKRYLV